MCEVFHGSMNAGRQILIQPLLPLRSEAIEAKTLDHLPAYAWSLLWLLLVLLLT